MLKYAGIVINSNSIQLDRIFTYSIPEKFLDKIEIGMRVYVPFGLGNKKIDGFVIELYDEIDTSMSLKAISNIDYSFPVLRTEDIKLIDIMREKYLCTYMECIKTIFPSALFKGVKNKKENYLFVGEDLNNKFSKEPYVTIYDVVRKNNGKLTRSLLSNKFKLSLSSINTMIKHGFLISKEIVVNRYNDREYKAYTKKELNLKQKETIDFILNSDKINYLIHGITGSGKTEIYMNLVEEMINKNKECIILVPEIALTPQMVERFKGRFGKDITVFHSKLSDGEKYDEWLRVKKRNVKVAIGARSAIFLPFNNLGLIVIDEEHESSYKSDSDPKYNAREIAEMKSEFYNCKIVLGTATPSIETYYRCEKGEIQLITLEERADGAKLPDISVVDMREELLNNNKSIFSIELLKGMEEALSKKEQIILFLNRRGFSTFVSCRKCGYVFKCNQCDISLTYHFSEEYLLCHYCGSKQKVSKDCPKCGSKYVKYFGVGTEKIEQEVKKLFPGSRTLRMDFDTTRRKNSYEDIYNTFKNGKADILIGTQMIAKGLDFKNVTLVGVIAADLSLNLPDFRASERTFQLITQVSGRAGRGEKHGKVVVQTYNPDSYAIKYSTENNYNSFYNEEIKIRDLMNYPPYVELMLINLSSENEDILIKSIQNVGIILKNFFKNNDKIELLGPCPCEISRINNNFRWQIIIKGNLTNEEKKYVKERIYSSLKDVYNSIRVSIDANPLSLI
ncbi:primosomal protein N' [Clostridium sp. MSJ-11]|uniref:Replication restart protein PriA n=1 Tax=Clostridium mobile TaxID=2841512 RepID=A0ABS6EE74_9CLOT|nr:primosomal protein N' [Clostridium mobile]